MLVLFRGLNSAQRRSWKELMAAMTSYLTMDQYTLKKRPVKPSGPVALSCRICLMAFSISCSVKGLLRHPRTVTEGFPNEFLLGVS